MEMQVIPASEQQSKISYSVIGYGFRTHIILATTDLKEARKRFEKEIEKPQYPKIILWRHDSIKGDRRLTTWIFKEDNQDD